MVDKWTFYDGTDTYTFKVNPFTYSPPYNTKSITVQGRNGDINSYQTVMQPTTPEEWTFEGNIYDADTYSELESWLSKNWIDVSDHLGRTWKSVPVRFKPIDRRPTATNSARWTYTYTLLCVG